MTIAREKVPIKGRPPVELELRFTRHGPVIHQDEKNHLAFALKWSGSEPGGAAYLGSLAVSRAKNQQEFLEALKAWKIPGLNFVYGDVDGNIGWVAAALTPIRKSWDGLFPVPGWTGSYEWQGFLPVKDLPQSFAPPRRWLATANHNILPEGYSHPIAYEWAAPHRFLRIQQHLGASKKLTLDDFASMQHDNTSLPGLALARLLGKQVASDPKLAEPTKLLQDWNGELTRDSAAGALQAVWLQEITGAFFQKKDFDKDTATALKSLNHVGAMLTALERPTQAWFGAHPEATRNDLVATTFAKAVQRTRKLLGDDPKEWRWGKLHTVTFRHPLEKLEPAYAKAFNLGPVERPGDANTPQNARHDDTFQQVHGASYRHLLDLADWDRARATSTPGQSGQLGSPHYGDLLPMWAEAQYFPLAYSRSKVEEVTRQRLLLSPQ
jgi:penicillin amidase